MLRNRFPYVAVPPHQQYSIAELTIEQLDGIRVYLPYAKKGDPNKNVALISLTNGTYPNMTGDGAAVVFANRRDAETWADNDYHLRGCLLWEVLKAAGDMPVLVKVN
jgi:hypothetical protein